MKMMTSVGEKCTPHIIFPFISPLSLVIFLQASRQVANASSRWSSQGT